MLYLTLLNHSDVGNIFPPRNQWLTQIRQTQIGKAPTVITITSAQKILRIGIFNNCT